MAVDKCNAQYQIFEAYIYMPDICTKNVDILNVGEGKASTKTCILKTFEKIYMYTYHDSKSLWRLYIVMGLPYFQTVHFFI